jgi:hypothetical protein
VFRLPPTRPEVAAACLRKVALYYAAGSVGGLLVGLAGWIVGSSGIPDLMGVAVKLALDKATIYRLMVWGGIWALIFLLPLGIRPLWLKALIYTMAPVLTLLLVIVPARGGQMLLLDRGALAPLYVYLINTPWGFAAAYLGWMLGAEEG